jgi:hypothetical protein
MDQEVPQVFISRHKTFGPPEDGGNPVIDDDVQSVSTIQTSEGNEDSGFSTPSTGSDIRDSSASQTNLLDSITSPNSEHYVLRPRTSSSTSMNRSTSGVRSDYETLSPPRNDIDLHSQTTRSERVCHSGSRTRSRGSKETNLSNKITSWLNDEPKLGFHSKKPYISLSLLEEKINQRVIRDSLPQDVQLKARVNKIVPFIESNLKLFATAVLTFRKSKEDRLEAMESFATYQLTDQRIPLDEIARVKNCQVDFNLDRDLLAIVDADGQEIEIVVFSDSDEPVPTSRCQHNYAYYAFHNPVWTLGDLRAFYNNQWCFIAHKFDDKVFRYNLHETMVLPFLDLGKEDIPSIYHKLDPIDMAASGGRLPRRPSGSFGVVTPIKILTDHQTVICSVSCMQSYICKLTASIGKPKCNHSS